jgi:hypothetical protein
MLETHCRGADKVRRSGTRWGGQQVYVPAIETSEGNSNPGISATKELVGLVYCFKMWFEGYVLRFDWEKLLTRAL